MKILLEENIDIRFKVLFPAANGTALRMALYSNYCKNINLIAGLLLIKIYPTSKTFPPFPV
jgi:hypothetical protein